MFKALFRFFGGKSKSPASPAPSSRSSSAPVAAPAEPTAARERWQREASRSVPRDLSPEELCGITPEMPREEIAQRLAQLYQRHNRAASSLDPVLREDAEFMLETLSGLYEKYITAGARN